MFPRVAAFIVIVKCAMKKIIFLLQTYTQYFKKITLECLCYSPLHADLFISSHSTLPYTKTQHSTNSTSHPFGISLPFNLTVINN